MNRYLVEYRFHPTNSWSISQYSPIEADNIHLAAEKLIETLKKPLHNGLQQYRIRPGVAPLFLYFGKPLAPPVPNEWVITTEEPK
jgi:hypothetical protein